jgi:hypothetical protein
MSLSNYYFYRERQKIEKRSAEKDELQKENKNLRDELNVLKLDQVR